MAANLAAAQILVWTVPVWLLRGDRYLASDGKPVPSGLIPDVIGIVPEDGPNPCPLADRDVEDVDRGHAIRLDGVAIEEHRSPRTIPQALSLEAQAPELVRQSVALGLKDTRQPLCRTLCRYSWRTPDFAGSRRRFDASLRMADRPCLSDAGGRDSRHVPTEPPDARDDPVH